MIKRFVIISTVSSIFLWQYVWFSTVAIWVCSKSSVLYLLEFNKLDLIWNSLYFPEIRLVWIFSSSHLLHKITTQTRFFFSRKVYCPLDLQKNLLKFLAIYKTLVCSVSIVIIICLELLCMTFPENVSNHLYICSPFMQSSSSDMLFFTSINCKMLF